MTQQKIIHRYSASLVAQGAIKFYTLTMPTDVLGKTCFVTTRDEDPKNGFQRVLDVSRAQEIADYIDAGHSIPGAIILSAQPEAELTLVDRSKTIQFIEHPKAFLVLDGQHRVFGFMRSKSAIRVPVVIYSGLSRRDESRIFIDINTKQKPVSNELLFDIKSLAEIETDEEERLNAIFTLFHNEPASTLVGLTSAADRSRSKISRVTFYGALRPIMRSFGEKEPAEIFEILNSYLKSCIKGLAKRNLDSSITNAIVFKAFIGFFPQVARRVKDRFGKYHDEAFNEIIAQLFETIKDVKIRKPGQSYKDLMAYLEACFDSGFKI